MPYDGNRAVAGNLGRQRQDAGLTQEQLAPLIGVTLRTIQRWEMGDSEPRSSQWPRTAGALNVTVAELLGIDTEAAA